MNNLTKLQNILMAQPQIGAMVIINAETNDDTIIETIGFVTATSVVANTEETVASITTSSSLEGTTGNCWSSKDYTSVEWVYLVIKDEEEED